MLSLPDVYAPAFKKLESFAGETADWDGYGSFPAPAGVIVDATAFLKSCIENDLVRPSLILSSSGAVSVVWKKVNDVYISVVLAGRGYHTYSVVKASSPTYSAQVDGLDIDPALVERIKALSLPAITDALAKPYASAFEKLKAFSQIRSNWDGRGGRAATVEAINGATSFLNTSLCQSLPEPSLELRGSGTVTASWEDEEGRYIQVEITDNVRYSYAISRTPAVDTDGLPMRQGVLLVGVSKSLVVEQVLVDHVRQVKVSR